MHCELRLIDFDTIFKIWRNELWPKRVSAIESHSAMIYKSDKYDTRNFQLPSWYCGMFIDNELIGVNSGHMCADGMGRSRGLWVKEEHRRKGYATEILGETVRQAWLHNATAIWSYPRRFSWMIYERNGFVRTSDWHPCETSPENAYCILEK